MRTRRHGARATSGAIRSASWVRSFGSVPRDVAPVGPPVLHWQVPLSTGRCRIEAWAGPGCAGGINRDALLVVEHDDGLTLSVADGCTPTADTPRVDGDGARYAAVTVLQELAAAPQPRSMAGVLHDANTHLLDQFGPLATALRPRDRPQTAAAAVRITWSDDGVELVDVARAADCEVWARGAGMWYCLTPRDMLTRDARTAIAEWVDAHPDAPLRKRFAMERQVVERSDSWRCTALGRFATPKIDVAAGPREFQEIVIMTDGTSAGSLIRSGCNDVRAWPNASRSSRRPPDDIAMLRLERMC